MNLSRRSLWVSLSLHCSLLVVGIIWFWLGAERSGSYQPVKSELRTLEVRTVRLQPRKGEASAEVSPGKPKADPQLPAQKPPANDLISPAAVPPQRPLKPAPSSEAKPLDVRPTYPKATVNPNSKISRDQPVSPPRRRNAPTNRQSAPLWTLDDSPVGPPAGSESKESDTRPGQGDGPGLVIRARPTTFPSLKSVTGFRELKSASVTAEFRIARDGSTHVSLLKGTGRPDLDAEILIVLLAVKWTPKTVGGVPVSDIQVMDIDSEG